MKKLLLYSPFLWLRKVVVYFLVAIIVLGLVLYFVANSPLVIKKVADIYAPDYNISYSRIHGNVVTGLEIEDLAYNRESLARHITLKWNPNGLVNKKIIVNTLQIEKANMDAIKTFVSSFQSSEQNQSDMNESNISEPFAFGVSVDNISIELKPFVEQNIHFSNVILEVKNVEYANDKVSVGLLDLKIDSNVSKLRLNASLKNDKVRLEDNHLIGKIRLTPTKELFGLYRLPFRQESIGDIVIDMDVSEDRVVADLSAKMKQLLKTQKDGFNFDVDSLKSHVVYDIKKGSLQAETKGMLSTPYAKDILVTNLFVMDGNISYSGEIQAKQIIGVDAKFVKPLNNLEVSYSGNERSIYTDIKSDNLQGTFISDDFKQAKLHLETPEAILVRELVELPAELNQSKANIVLDVPISFDTNASLEAEAKILSNVINMDANISYKESLQVKLLMHIPEESLLRPYSKELKWDSLNPITADVQLVNDGVDATLKAGTLAAKAYYDLKSTKVDGKIVLGGLQADIVGIAKEKININTKIHSMNTLIESIKGIYTLAEVPVVKGSADLSIGITALKKVDLTLKSPEIIYQPDKKTEHRVNDINVVIMMEDSKVQLTRYALTYEEQHFFATKPSIITFKDDIVNITPLWLNDELQVQGEYNVKAKKGTVNAQAMKLQIVHEIIDLDNAIDINTVLDGNKTSVKGKVILSSGNIHYDLGQKSFASDSDIIIVQDIKKKEDSIFMDNLSVEVQVKTGIPLVYHKGAINVKAIVDLVVHKAEYSDLMVLGSIEILQGGSYIFEGKKFVLGKSYVYFTGDPNKPLIEASVKHKSLNHLITITITGTANTPNINFSSVPTLTKEEILSIILFDSQGGAGTNSGEDMMKMMGGAMAKSALSNFGVKLDHLVLGASGSVEVGKKLTDKVTVIYVNGEVPTVNLKYEHGEHTESVLGASEESTSYDIVYKRDFKDLKEFKDF